MNPAGMRHGNAAARRRRNPRRQQVRQPRQRCTKERCPKDRCTKERCTNNRCTRDRISQPREDGQLMVLIIGYVLLALLVATVVTAASSVYIEHKKLLSVADGASVAAADSFTLGQLETAAGSPTAVLNSGRVRSAAVDYLDRNGAFSRFAGLEVAPATGSPDGSTAVVVLSAAVHPPVVNFLVPDGIRIEASSTARSRLTR